VDGLDGVVALAEARGGKQFDPALSKLLRNAQHLRASTGPRLGRGRHEPRSPCAQ
jgi:hypothetical protein